jgi:Co/Zn/Cd efflux system component
MPKLKKPALPKRVYVSVPQTEHKTNILKIPGVILIAYAVAGLIVNLNVAALFNMQVNFIKDLSFFGVSFWNPLSYFTQGIWIIGDAMGLIVAIVWGLALAVIGAILAK